MGTRWLSRIVASTVAACGVVLATAVAPRSVSRRSLGVFPSDSPLSSARSAGEVFVLDTATELLGAAIEPWTVVVSIGAACSLLPVAFVATDSRLRFSGDSRSASEPRERAIVVGNSGERIERILRKTEFPIVGYVSPAGRAQSGDGHERDAGPEPAGTAVGLTDGGAVVGTRFGDRRRLGDLSGLLNVFETYDIERAILAFATPDRTDFFGALAACEDHGVSVTVPDEFAESVLVKGSRNGTVDVDLEPWDRSSCFLKRLFDTVFAVTGLVVLVPVIVVIAVAIRLDSAGPILYSQDRTTKFGRTFRLYKFRTMTPGSGDTAPVNDEENANITRIGRFLRRTHLDEIPQLYSILVGDMSVVGPRATWIEEEEQFLDVGNGRWRKRWFVKPGLTGLAQINDVSSTDPELKLHYDLEYIHHQSFAFDVWLVAQQIRLVSTDVVAR